MLFASHSFLAFLVIVLGAYGLATHRWPHVGKPLLIAASLVFYGYWIPAYLLILLCSLLFNHAIALRIMNTSGPQRQSLTAVGVALNLLLLGYY